MRERLMAIVTATAPPLPARPAAGATTNERLHWLWLRGKHGWPARYPLAQFPNAPLLLSFVASALVGLLSTDAAPYARVASSLFLGCWAWLEVSAGVNLFRRVTGLVFLGLIIADLGQRIS